MVTNAIWKSRGPAVAEQRSHAKESTRIRIHVSLRSLNRIDLNRLSCVRILGLVALLPFPSFLPLSSSLLVWSSPEGQKGGLLQEHDQMTSAETARQRSTPVLQDHYRGQAV